MKKLPVLLAPLLLLALVASVSAGPLVPGTTVNGSLRFNQGGTWIGNSYVGGTWSWNFYDPAAYPYNNFVPPGYGNSTSPNDVPIIDPGIEFCFQESAGRVTADLTFDRLTIVETYWTYGHEQFFYPWKQEFTVPGLTSVWLISNSFPFTTDPRRGGMYFGISGDTLTIDWDGGTRLWDQPGGTLVLGLGTSVPEPSLPILQSIGIAGVLAFAWRYGRG